MPAFVLLGAIVLCLSALCSFVIVFWISNSEGKLRLVGENSGRELDDVGNGTDIFDVTQPHDMVDGDPVNEEIFWKEAKLIKLLLCVCLAAIVAVEATALGFSVAADETAVTVVVCVLHLVFAIYVLCITGYSIQINVEALHWRLVMHSTALTALAFITFSLGFLLPIFSSTASRRPFTLWSWYISLWLYLASSLISATIPRRSRLHFPLGRIYSRKTTSTARQMRDDNVSGVTSGSIWDILFMTYITEVAQLSNIVDQLQIPDLPILPANMRSTFLFSHMRSASKHVRLPVKYACALGTGWELIYRLARVNLGAVLALNTLYILQAPLLFAPAFFMQKLITYLEMDPERSDKSWGWLSCAGLFIGQICFLLSDNHGWFASIILQTRIRIQLNSTLFAKTLVLQDVASSSAAEASSESIDGEDYNGTKTDAVFSSKAQILTLMTTDVDRISSFYTHLSNLIRSTIEAVIGFIFLYTLLGSSAFWGMAVAALFLPVNHYAGKLVEGVQGQLMAARDERASLMNELLAGIRMLKFMAWERIFERKVLTVREKELRYQRQSFLIETLFNAIWGISPILVILIAFWHFTIIRHQPLLPSTAFTAISVLMEMQSALTVLPETLIGMFQSFVSIRRVEKYLAGVEVASVASLGNEMRPIVLRNASITWPRATSTSSSASDPPTPHRQFSLTDMSIEFPLGKVSLICGRFGSGKTLLLLALLGEADVVTGQIAFTRSPPNAVASYIHSVIPRDGWVVPGLCAYVPQTAWLQNASIRENILFSLPFVEERYRRTLEVCALIQDLEILADGDETEIGERGLNLSGGQKARVSLARAVYSRASTILLDDVLSAVDAHTAKHLYHECILGDLMHNRTVILVSHHIQLCIPGASHIVVLDNGRIQFQGNKEAFEASGVISSLALFTTTDGIDNKEPQQTSDEKLDDVDIAEVVASISQLEPEPSDGAAARSEAGAESLPKRPRRLVKEETRVVGDIDVQTWRTYIFASGGSSHWSLYFLIITLATLTVVAQNMWLEIWSNSVQAGDLAHSAAHYISTYAAIMFSGFLISTVSWYVLYTGSIRASRTLYKRLLDGVLFAQPRFHDTVSRGQLLNRFGKDFEGIDSSLADMFGRSSMNAISAIVTLITITVVGRLALLVSGVILGMLYWSLAKAYRHTARDMRRIESISQSPLYSMYGDAISGVVTLRAFGATTTYLREMLRCIDTNTSPFYWARAVNQWVTLRLNLLSGIVLGLTGVVCLEIRGINAGLAGFALTFASSFANDVVGMVQRAVFLEQSMVAVERVKEYCELPREGLEHKELRPAPSWPSAGSVICENLSVCYAPGLPDVLHQLNFSVSAGEKIGILGRTGSGKSTLALTLFRFLEPREGRILIDGLDISHIGITDLRSPLTIIPQDPVILSGTLRSNLDILGQYEDSEIFDALRRVHLIPVESGTVIDELHKNVFRSLDSAVSEGGDNFSTGEKQLLCMARAILKRSKLLVMDEATASVDYATDELISKTIREEFAESTVLTIAHRLRTIIDYDKVMLLDEGHMVEFDAPAALITETSSKFHALCKASGESEFAVLKEMALKNLSRS